MSLKRDPKIIDLRGGANTIGSLIEKHPLQRLNSPSRSISALVHVAGLVSFFYSFHYLQYFPSEIGEAYGIIALSIATSTFIFGILADITLNPTLFLIKNALGVASAPLEVLISLLYWGISAIDRSLVVPPGMQIDTFVDLSLHLFPAVLLLIDVLLLSPPWTIGVVPALVAPATIATGYWFWLEHCFSHNGWYPYPLMNQMKTEERVVLFIGSALTMAGSTIALKWAFGRVNGRLEGGVPGNVKRD